ncbi:hypothetical protein LCGC14_3138300, partial [marine sediment metagenome]
PRQFIAFSMCGLEVSAPALCAKAQILVSELDTAS